MTSMSCRVRDVKLRRDETWDRGVITWNVNGERGGKLKKMRSASPVRDEDKMTRACPRSFWRGERSRTGSEQKFENRKTRRHPGALLQYAA